MTQTQPLPPQSSQSRSRAPLYWLLAVCIAPTVAAFYTFYFVSWQPNTETTNYGELLPNPIAMPNLNNATTLDGKPFNSKLLYKKWVYTTVDSGICDEPCAKRLFTTRQLRAITGRERERVARLWLVTDNAPINAELLTAHPELIVLRIKPQDVAFLNVSSPAGHAPTNLNLTEHIWIIDPIGRPMMRYPVDYQPDRMKKDLTKLLYASQSWQH